LIAAPPLLSFPTRRSSDLLRGHAFFSRCSFPGKTVFQNSPSLGSGNKTICLRVPHFIYCSSTLLLLQIHQPSGRTVRLKAFTDQDRKSTRLNSSHVKISYA